VTLEAGGAFAAGAQAARRRTVARVVRWRMVRPFLGAGLCWL
jgi:hypothetical protein